MPENTSTILKTATFNSMNSKKSFQVQNVSNSSRELIFDVNIEEVVLKCCVLNQKFKEFTIQ